MTAIQTVGRIRLTLFLAGCVLLLPLAGVFESWFSLQFSELSVSGAHRVLTCHLLHWSAEHLMWDLAVFVILGAVCEWRSPIRYAAALLLSAVAIPPCIMWWLPGIDSYRGLSGIDTALFGLLVADLLVRRIKDRDWMNALVFSLFLVGLFGKIAMEMNSGANIFVSDTSFIPIPLSHFVGAIIGLAIGVCASCIDFAECFVIRRCRSWWAVAT